MLIFLLLIDIIVKKGGLDVEGNKVKVLITGQKAGENAAKEFAEIYDEIFEVEFDGDFPEFDTAFDKASVSGMTHMLYFQDDINLLLVSLADELGGYTAQITVDDLKNVLSQNAHDSI